MIGGFVWLSLSWLRSWAHGGFSSVIKVILFLVCLALQVLPTDSWAQVVPDNYWRGGTNSNNYKDPAAECAAQDAASTFYTGNRWTYAGNDPNAISGTCYFSANGYNPYSIFGFGANRYTCSTATPYFSSTTNTCTSTPPIDPNECADKNPMIRRWDYSGSGGVNAPDHFGNCKVAIIEMLVCRKDAVTGKPYCMWMVQRTGERWSGTEVPGGAGSAAPEKPGEPPIVSPPIKPPPPATPDICKTCVPCPKGTVQGGIGPDGVPMCIGTGTNPPPPPPVPPVKTSPPVTTTNADGSTTTTTTSQQTNSDGSTSTTTSTVTTAPDGTKTTGGGTVVSATPTGAPGRTDTPETDKNNFCKQNPMLAVCRDSSVAGTCGEITCTGDAIQCSTLRAAAAMECKGRTDEAELKASAAYVLGAAALAGNDPAAATLPTVKTGSIVDVAGMSNEGWLGAGQAFSDVSFSIQGKTIVVPLNKWSGYLVGLRYALMVAAMLISFRMLSGVILRD